MKSFFLLLACCFFVYCLPAQPKNSWSWESGDIPILQSGWYGIKGVTGADNHPGERRDAVSWKTAAGDLWLFGGQRISTVGNAPSLNLNDLWKFSVSLNQWTWVSGDNTPDKSGVYGQKGIAAAANKPGARQSAVTWTDASGVLWLYGGVYEDNFNFRNTVTFSDLWKYEPATNRWTWVNGGTASSVRSSYGLKGVASVSNTPGTRTGSLSWVDTAGNFWLFGGQSYASNGLGFTDDVWKYNPATNLWTWMQGDTTALTSGDNVSMLRVFGTKGTAAAANKPGARSGAVGSPDRSGNFWLFGGQREKYPSFDYYNDLWKYDVSTNQWAWISGDSAVNVKSSFGNKGIAATDNAPGGRTGAQGWTDSLGRLWLFGGGTDVYTANAKVSSDLWRYDETENLWTWVGGDSSYNANGNYETKGTASAASQPTARYSSLGWQDGTGNFWLFGGGGNPFIGVLHQSNDLWKFNAGSGLWTWASGHQLFSSLSVPGTKGTPGAANTPGSREESVSWTDLAGDLWLFGGEYGKSFHDLWKYDHVIRQWTLVNGDTLQDQQPVYGIRNVPDSSNNPGARSAAVGWTDRSGNLWLFGGKRNLTIASGPAFMNDLWKFDPKTALWTWVSGDSTASRLDAPQKGSYGTKGMANPANKPFPRYNAIGLTDSAGNFWLFGGSCVDLWVESTLNDLWKFDVITKQWTWMSGDSTYSTYQKPLLPVYGTKGTASPANQPGSKTNTAGWSDKAGNLWIYSGSNVYNASYTSTLNDLWKYNIATGFWTFVQGNSNLGSKASYGNKGIPDAANQPGQRYKSLSWTDTSGNGWLFGGSATNDLWKFDSQSTLWTWMSGDSIPRREGRWGVKGVPDTNNTPGARTSGIGWTDKSNNLWMFGGTGVVQTYFSAMMNDLWKFSTTDLALPLQFTAFSAQKNNDKVVLRWNTGQEVNNAYFIVQRSANGFRFDSIGRIAARPDPFAAHNGYLFSDLNPYNGHNYYRLKQVDQDGHFTYSAVNEVYYEAPDFTYSILNNPVMDQATIIFHSAGTKKVQVQVVDASGRSLYNEQTAISPGNEVYSIPCSDWKKGIYFLTVRSPQTHITKQFMKR